MQQRSRIESPPTTLPKRLAVLAWAFLRLGCVSFGGPIAHIGYLRTEFVGRRDWLDEAQYSDLVALCQFLPGPTSSQVVFALGMHHAGVLGALLASVCFTLPSALLMIAAAYGLTSLANPDWLHGLLLAAVAVVAQAVWGMGRILCSDRARQSLCIASACAILWIPSVYTQLVVLILGAGFGIALSLAPQTDSIASPEKVENTKHRAPLAALLLFFVLLALLPVLANTSRMLDEAARFYRTGSLVFGGGHVVLPLLHTEFVPHKLSESQFLGGYSVAQALPGPLFAFAAYLGTAMHEGTARWLYGLWCLLAIYLPSWLLVFGVFPFWQRLRSSTRARAGLAGTNAAIVGILLAALYRPIFTEAVQSPFDLGVVLVAFLCLESWKIPPWLVVLGCTFV